MNKPINSTTFRMKEKHGTTMLPPKRARPLLTAKADRSSFDSQLKQSKQSKSFRIVNDAASIMSSVSGLTEVTSKHTRSLHLTTKELYGRAQEQKTLVQCFREARCSRRLVFVGGEAGSGKSALTDWLECQVIAEDSILLSGKHTLTQTEEPYSAISQICRRVCLDVIGTEDTVMSSATGWSNDKQSGAWCTNAEYITNEFRDKLGGQAEVLTRIVPSLQLLIGKQKDSASGTDSRLDERNQLHNAFRAFFRILSEYKTLVLVLDDLQWADQASLDLLEYLIRDRDNSALMVVGCYRNNEINLLHPFSKTLSNFENADTQRDERLTVTHMSIDNLDVAALDEIVQSVLSLQATDDTYELAMVIHSRTLGNAFFSFQFLKSLVEDGLIVLDSMRSEYTWNLDQIKQMTSATADAVELMQAKLEKLPTAIKSIVRLASVLGNSVHIDLFSLIVNDFYSNQLAYGVQETVTPQKQESTRDILTTMVDEGLMYRSEKKEHRWEHDKILEAALLPTSQRAKTYFRIGELLQKKLSSSKLSYHIFTVVRLLNEGSQLIPSTSSQKRVNLAELNLQAGKKSMENSGFESAQTYFNKGITLLPSNHARVYKSLSLELISSAAESEYCTGDMESMEKHCREVISRPNIPLQDKRRVFTALMDGLNGQGRCAETVELSIDLLAQLGCSIPKRFLIPRILSGVLQMKAVEKRGIAAELDKIPPMSDPDKLWCMDILADLFKYAYLADMPNIVAVVLFKSFQWSLKFGRSPKVSMFLAQVGMLASTIGEYRVGRAYVDQSLIELETRSTEKLVCDVTALIYTLAWHWTDDVDVKMLAKGHADGTAAGVAENASWNMEHSLKHRLFIGAALAPLRDDAAKYSFQMKELNVRKPHDLTVFCLQATLNLMGKSDCRSRLSGTEMKESTLLLEYKNVKDNLSIAVMRLFQFYLAFFFDDFHRIFEIRKEHNESQIEVSVPGQFGLCVMYYCNAMAAISMYRQEKKAAYLRTANKLASKVKGWTEAGNPNVVHYSMMLDAEFADLKGNSTKAEQFFKSAIQRAEIRRQISDVAKGEQRLGEFYLRQKNDRSEQASIHLQRAAKLYTEWGAHGVSDQLHRCYTDSMVPVANVNVSAPTDSLSGGETSRTNNLHDSASTLAIQE